MMGQGDGIPRRHQKAVVVMVDEFPGGAGCSGDGGQTEMHALQIDDAEAFVGGGHRQEVAGGAPGRQFLGGDGAQQGYPGVRPAS